MAVGGRNPPRHCPPGGFPGWRLETHLGERATEEDLDLVAVDHLQIGWLGGELGQPVNVDSLCDEFGRGADGILWVKAIAKDETRRKPFQPNPLRRGQTGLVSSHSNSMTNGCVDSGEPVARDSSGGDPRTRQTASLGCAAWQQKSCRCGSA